MIKVIDIELNGCSWEGEYIDDNTETNKYWTCPAVEKSLNEGWNIKDWKMADHDVIFILEKSYI